MFWEVWRNISMSTSNWGLGGNSSKKGNSSKSKSTKRSCYNRLISSTTSDSSSGPKKSASQPVNLTQFIQDDLFGEMKESTFPSSVSHNTPNNNISSIADKQMKCRGNVKRSFSSFFPFASCASNESSSAVQSESNSGATQHHQPSQQHKVTQSKENETKEATDEIIDYWDDNMELPTCDVCAKAFPTVRQLAAHQRKKRHYGCIECDSIFPSREVLECHREQMCHYEFAIDMYSVNERDLDQNDEADFFESDDDDLWDEDQEDCDDEEMEKLI